jgi:long-chain acyl-CoA synthetase
MGGTSSTTAEGTGTGAKTLAAMVVEAGERYDGAAMRYSDNDRWIEMSYADLVTAAREIAGGLIDQGVEAGDRVAIFSDTSPEWTLADLGILLAGAVTVPVYQTASAEEAKHVLADSEAKVVFVQNEELLKTAREAAQELDVGLYIVFDDRDLDKLRKRGADQLDEVDKRVEAIEPDDVFTLIYTSGTTGPPKGCVLTHGNYRANAQMLEEVAEIHSHSVVFLFLPLAHALSRMTQMIAIDLGACIGYWRGEKDLLMDDLKEIKPTHFPAVPRIFEKIYEQAHEQADGKVKGKLFESAVDIGREVRHKQRLGETIGPALRAEYEVMDRRVLSKVRDLFGGKLEYALTGAAPVKKEMLEFFDACGVLILEGYGSTETSAVVSANAPDDFKFGTVGKPLPGTDVKIGDSEGEDAGGEILVRGPHVFQGYRGLEEETKEVLDEDGWFHTGDLGEIDDEGFLKIAGRTKEIIVTSSGKNITPTNIEEKIGDSKAVSQAIVVGDDRPYLVALIAANGSGEDGEGPDEAAIQKAIDEANKDLANIEQVKKFKVLPRELSQEEGELTPTLKVKREKVYENFKDEIEELYGNRDEG